MTQAEGGTLFLDEIDALEPSAQVKLLRFLQQHEYRRLGETSLRKANVRIVAASNADLYRSVRESRFREDLFFRIHVFPVGIPPLRERPEDIEPLLAEYVQRSAEHYGTPPVRFAAETLRRLETYAWPGNVREIENCVRYLTSLRLDRAVETTDLKLFDGLGPAGTAFSAVPALSNGVAAASGVPPLRDAKRSLVGNFERIYLIDALRASDGNIGRAARASGKPRRAFFELMRKYGIRADAYGKSDGHELISQERDTQATSSASVGFLNGRGTAARWRGSSVRDCGHPSQPNAQVRFPPCSSTPGVRDQHDDLGGTGRPLRGEERGTSPETA